jgi:hypothetical protein
MKKYVVLILTLILSQASFAIDQDTVNSLNRKGFDVIMGELTGAGSKFSINRLAGFVLNDGILLKENCHKIVIAKSESSSVASIVQVEFENQVILASEFEGIIIKR